MQGLALFSLLGQKAMIKLLTLPANRRRKHHDQGIPTRETGVMSVIGKERAFIGMMMTPAMVQRLEAMTAALLAARDLPNACILPQDGLEGGSPGWGAHSHSPGVLPGHAVGAAASDNQS